MKQGSKKPPKSVEETTVTRDANGVKTGEKQVTRVYRYDDELTSVDILTTAMFGLLGGALITLGVIKLASQMF